jgi:hypothetical protein
LPEQPLGLLNPPRQRVLVGTLASAPLEELRKVKHAHSGSPGEISQPQLLIRLFVDVRQDAIQSSSAGNLEQGKSR